MTTDDKAAGAPKAAGKDKTAKKAKREARKAKQGKGGKPGAAKGAKGAKAAQRKAQHAERSAESTAQQNRRTALNSAAVSLGAGATPDAIFARAEALLAWLK
jgi:hypothetical protein